MFHVVSAPAWSALADPRRRAVLDLLRVRPRSVGELSEAVGLSQPSTSKHLRIDDRPALRFVRDLPHPATRVWAMLTGPEQLAGWFPARPAFPDGLAVGAPVGFTFTTPGDGGSGSVLAVDPPRRLAATWEGDELWFDLAEAEAGTRLTFTTVIAADDTAARNAAGWEVCLAALDDRLAGTAPEPVDWRPIYDASVDAGVPSGAPFPGG